MPTTFITRQGGGHADAHDARTAAHGRRKRESGRGECSASRCLRRVEATEAPSHGDSERESASCGGARAQAIQATTPYYYVYRRARRRTPGHTRRTSGRARQQVNESQRRNARTAEGDRGPAAAEQRTKTSVKRSRAPGALQPHAFLRIIQARVAKQAAAGVS